MFRGLKKIRKSFADAQKNRSSGSESDDNFNNNSYFNNYEQEFLDSTPSSPTVIGSGLIRNVSQSSAVSTGSNGGGSYAVSGASHVVTSTSGTAMKQQQSSSKTTSTTKKTTFLSTTKKSRNEITMDKATLLAKSPFLSSFDKCIEASDTMIASSYTPPSSSTTNESSDLRNNYPTETIFATRHDQQTGLPDCSLLVSPDGDLLLVPNDQSNIGVMFQPITQPKTRHNQQNSTQGNPNANDGLSESDEYPTLSSPSTTAGLGSFSELIRQSKDDYESAMIIGNDLHGDKLVNRFTARGWSVPATTLAIQQTEFAIQSMAQFCEQYVLTRKESAAQMTMACDQWRTEFNQLRGFQPNKKDEIPMTSDQWEILDPRALSFEISPSRVGPYTSHGSTLLAAAMAVEQYHHEAAEKESQRWRKATVHGNGGVLPAIQSAYETYRERATKRQQALSDISHRVKIVEDRIRNLKQLSQQKWEIVYKAEKGVTIRMEELMSKRSKEKQKSRLKQLLRDQQQYQSESSISSTTPNTAPSTTTTSNIDDIQITCNLSEEVWDMVSSVAESMEHGSFEPIPDTSSTISDELSLTFGNAGVGSQQQHISNNDEVLVSHPIVTREEIEQEMGVPELRISARQVDDAIQEESGTLLNILSLLDTTRRSARLAAETCLVSAGHAQVKCLRGMLQQERESLQERLRDLDGLEQVLDKVDIRSDLDTYILADKKEVGGCSHLGDDDDGGIASALAVLSSHVDGIMMGQESHHSAKTSTTRQRAMSTSTDSQDHTDNDKNADENDAVTANMIDIAIDKVFHLHPALKDDIPKMLDAEGNQYRIEFDKNVAFICHSISGNTSKAQNLRSSLCYLLNSKRGMNAQISTMKQYNAIGKIFSTILTHGLHDAEIGISNAKMCMMLAQTFYYLKDGQIQTETAQATTLPTTGQPKPNGFDVFEPADDSETKKSDDGTTLKTIDNRTNGNTDFSVNTSLSTSLSKSSNNDRQHRMYIKNALIDHPVWAKDDFWDSALSQQISESLTHSGVMSNFDARRVRASRIQSHEKHSSMTQWYDLNYVERVEAASQVHAVVFAQLGALAHSMIEFDCGLERSCAFVRRMSVRNQLPSSHRTMLLQHLIQRDDVGRRESNEVLVLQK